MYGSINVFQNTLFFNVCNLLGISPASDYCWMPTFRNNLSVPSSKAGYEVWSEVSLWRWNRQIVPKRRNSTIIRRRGNTQKLHTIFKTRRKFEIKNTLFFLADHTQFRTLWAAQSTSKHTVYPIFRTLWAAQSTGKHTVYPIFARFMLAFFVTIADYTGVN